MHEFNKDDVIAERYKIVEEIGRGGFGTVYKAWHTNLQCDVAVKTLQLDHSELTNQEAPEAFERFRKEAQALTKLAHTGIVQVIDFGFAGKSTPYLVMKYAPGVPLLKWGEQNKPTTLQWLTVFKKIFEALEHAHDQGIIHRDLKSSNIFVSGPVEKPKVSIIDWGIAYSAGSERLTQADAVIGTPGFIDPYNYKHPGANFVPQSDFYAVGGVLFWALCNCEPHKLTKDMSPVERLSVRANNELVRPSAVNPEISKMLERFILRLMATDRELRPPTARACIAIIEKLERDEEFDLDEVYAAYPYVPLTPTSADAPQKAAPGEAPGDKDANNALAEQLQLAKAKADAIRSKETLPLHVPHGLGQAGLDLSALRKKAEAKNAAVAFESNAAKLGFEIQRPAAPRRVPAYVWPIAAAIVAVLGTLVATGTLSMRHSASDTTTSFVPHPVSPADLERKTDETTLGKFAPEQAQAPANALSGFSPEIKANYPPTLGGNAPPAPAGGVHASDHSKYRKHSRDEDDEPPAERKKDEFDRTLRPAGSPGTDRGESTADTRNLRLSVPHNTEADVRLVDMLDTSNGEPVRVELVASLRIKGELLIPIGSTLWGKASLGQGRAQVTFDRVVLPSGEERRIFARAVTTDGRDGIDAGIGRFEQGTPPDGKAAEKVLRAAGTIASEVVSSVIPGTDGLSRSAQQLSQDEIREAAQARRDDPKAKDRVIVQRKARLSIKFSAS